MDSEAAVINERLAARSLSAGHWQKQRQGTLVVLNDKCPSISNSEPLLH